MFHLSHPLRCRGGREGAAGGRGAAGERGVMLAAGQGPALGMHWEVLRVSQGVGAGCKAMCTAPPVPIAASIMLGERQLGARGSASFVPESQASQFLLGEFGYGNVERRHYGFPEHLVPMIYYRNLQLESIPAF